MRLSKGSWKRKRQNRKGCVVERKREGRGGMRTGGGGSRRRSVMEMEMEVRDGAEQQQAGVLDSGVSSDLGSARETTGSRVPPTSH